jgi:hypothetical protein
MSKWIKSGWTMGMAAVFGLVMAADAQAQFCVGYPTVGGQGSVGVRAAFPDRGDIFGVEASYNMAGPLSVFGSFNLWSPSAPADADNVNILGAGVAFDISNMVPPMLPGFSVCPTAGISFFTRNDQNHMEIPIGLGIGADFGTPGGPSVMPYAIPHVRLIRIGDADPRNPFGLEAGFLARFGAFHAGVSLNRLFEDDATNDLSIRVGMTFGAR